MLIQAHLRNTGMACCAESRGLGRKACSEPTAPLQIVASPRRRSYLRGYNVRRMRNVVEFRFNV
jgi:hypothetical protein